MVIKRDRDRLGKHRRSHRESLHESPLTNGMAKVPQLRRHPVASRQPAQPALPDPELFRAHAGRFAHQLDAAMGHHTMQAATENDRLTVHRTLAAMIGVAARRYAEWELIDPEELILGGTYDGTLLWKRNEQDYIDTDEALCGQCDGATFARRFLKKADLPAFRRAWRQGIIYSADRTVNAVGASSCSTWLHRPRRTSTTRWTSPTTWKCGMIDHYDETCRAHRITLRIAASPRTRRPRWRRARWRPCRRPSLPGLRFCGAGSRLRTRARQAAPGIPTWCSSGHC